MKMGLAARRSDQSLLSEILHGRAGDGLVIHDPRIDHRQWLGQLAGQHLVRMGRLYLT